MILALFLPEIAAAQSSDRQRPIRVGNRNVINIGGGYREHDHPTFSEKAFIAMGYQRRILRREVRWLPLWVRGGFDYSSESVDLQDTYAVWPDGPGDPFPESLVQERTSDAALRFELLGDIIHLPNFALYGGGGIIIHVVSFSSRGTTRKFLFERRENYLGPSLVGGGRLFMKTKPWAIYAEARYRRVYGKLTPPPNGVYFTEQDFDFMSVNSLSIEGGLALHW